MSTHYILATAGHVDHGKSGLVKALTGTDPDRLPEEKARGITIDLGFAQLGLSADRRPPASDFESQSPAPPPPTASYELGIVDVPGHEDFVKNMVAGVGSIDLALLAVAADDGWMPQTEEHLQILDYLGVSQAVVALTKADLVPDSAARVNEVRQHLQNSPFRSAPIVPTSVLTRRGLPELQDALAQVLATVRPPRDIGKPRLNVDRVFVVQGVGTVVTGTLAGGRFRRGQTVCVQPGARVTRIRGMQSHNQDIEEAGPGRRVALNLPDLEALVGVARGDVVTTHDTGDASDTLDVVLCKSPRLMDAQVPGARPLKDGTPVRVHLGSANVAARVLLVGPAPLTAGGEALAQLRLETPLLALAGDRFIVRDASEQATLAGGFVLVPGAPRNRWRSAQNQAFLRVARTAVHSASELARAWIQLRLALRCDRLLQQSRFGADEISAGTARLIQARQAVAAGEWLVDAAWWSDLHAAAARQIEAYHASHPELPGLPLTALKSALSERVAAAGLLDLLVKDLTTQGYVVRENAIRRADFRPALPPQLERAGERLRQRLAEESLEVPSRAALAPDAMSQQALRYLVQAGEAVELGPDLVIGMAAWTRARATVRRVLRQQGRATTSELRQALGSNRRVTIPLLESLDRQGFTRREGDQRVLRADSEEAG